MRRAMVIGVVLLAILAGVGIGVAAYNAGVSEGVADGLRQSGQDTQMVRVVGPRFGHGYGYGYGFFPFGLILFPLLVIGVILLVRGVFWRGRWGGPGYGPGGWGYGPPGPWGHGGPQRFEEWHRRQHDQPSDQPSDQAGDQSTEKRSGGGEPTGA
ncbi:MAG TPA: hypothetical protein VFU54_02255 [Actinomycetota bacterium]|nr:hypothetical protein [Actinomycetota bacterium]